MSWKRLSILVASFSMVVTVGCAALQKSKDLATDVIPHGGDERLFSQLPDEKKDVINPLLDASIEGKEHLELAKALVKKKEAELDLEKAKKDLAEIELEIREAELNLGKMKAVQSAGLGDPKKVNRKVAKLEAKVYTLKGEEAEQKAKVRNAQLAVEEARSKVKGTETGAQKKDRESTTLK